MNGFYIERLAQFVKLYSIFSNNYILDNATSEEKTLFEILRKYKLASSEGLNKHTNRMIRYNILKDFLFVSPSEASKAAENVLFQKMSIEGCEDTTTDDPDE